MPSTIDPTVPGDDMPASKADVRANLAAAKAELEHGGFAEGLIPTNYGPPATSRTIDHLQAIDDALGAGLGGGAAAFTELADAPSSYVGQANRYPRVRAEETGLEFVDQAAGGDASTTSYTAPGKGAITRSVGDKLRDVLSVKDFGAKGDGSTDDTTAIQAAINYAENVFSGPAAGPTVWFPLGNYCISAPIVTTARSSLMGCKRGSWISALSSFPSTYTYLTYTFPAPMIWVNGTTAASSNYSVELVNLFLDGGSPSFYAPVGLAISGGVHVMVRNLRVMYNSLDNIVIDATQNSMFLQPVASHAQRDNVRIVNGVGWLNITHPFFASPNRRGINFDADDSNWPGVNWAGSIPTNGFVVIRGGLLEAELTAGQKTHAVYIAGATNLLFDNVSFYSPFTTAQVEIAGGPIIAFRECNFSGNFDTAPVLINHASRVSLIRPAFLNFSPSGHLLQTDVINGLHIEYPTFNNANPTGAGKLIAWTGGTASDKLRGITYRGWQQAGNGTGQRPDMSKIDAVEVYWDLSTGKPAWWDPVHGIWKDATGNSV